MTETKSPQPAQPLSDGFDDWWSAHRVKRVLNPAGVARMVWVASARHNRKTVLGATESTSGFYPEDEGSIPSGQATFQAPEGGDTLAKALERTLYVLENFPGPNETVSVQGILAAGMALSDLRAALAAQPHCEGANCLKGRGSSEHSDECVAETAASQGWADAAPRALAYQQANPLGGPAKVFRAMADAIEAGDSYEATLRSFGYAEAKPSPAEGDGRAAFEAWTDSFYGGLATAADTWDEQRRTYTDGAHHMAWCAWRHLQAQVAALSREAWEWSKALEAQLNVQPKGTAADRADHARRLAEDWADDCVKAGYVTTGAPSHKTMAAAINALAATSPAPVAAIPAGWDIKRHDDGGFVVRAPDGSAAYAHATDDKLSIAANVLAMLVASLSKAPVPAHPVAWVNLPIKSLNGEMLGYGEPEVGWVRKSNGYDWSKARPLVYADAQAPAVGAEAEPVGHFIEDFGGEKGWWLQCRGAATYTTPLFRGPSAPAGGSDEARDAARYRFIRNADRCDDLIGWDELVSLAMDDFDGAVDEAMSREGQPPVQGSDHG